MFPLAPRWSRAPPARWLPVPQPLACICPRSSGRRRRPASDRPHPPWCRPRRERILPVPWELRLPRGPIWRGAGRSSGSASTLSPLTGDGCVPLTGIQIEVSSTKCRAGWHRPGSCAKFRRTMIDADAHLECIRTQFGKQADVYARMRQTTNERSLNALVQISGADAGSRVLDVACGPGFLTMAFAARCGHAGGVAAPGPFLAMARAVAEERGQHNVEFRAGNAEQLPFGDSSFDLVSCRAAFHHFARPGHVLAEMTRVATPQGRLL